MDNVSRIRRFLKWTGIAVVAIGLSVQYADDKGWLAERDRKIFLQWAVGSEASLSMKSSAAQAFARRFPPPSNADRSPITRIAKRVNALQDMPEIRIFYYALEDGTRTGEVATLASVREWAKQSNYPRLGLLLGIIGLTEIVASAVIEERLSGKPSPMQNPNTRQH